jgi:dynein heavy chain
MTRLNNKKMMQTIEMGIEQGSSIIIENM